jgi:hypothetical protein
MLELCRSLPEKALTNTMYANVGKKAAGRSPFGLSLVAGICLLLAWGFQVDVRFTITGLLEFLRNLN